ILVLGDGGKDFPHYAVVSKAFVERAATIGVDYFEKDVLIGNRTISVRIWDTAGQARASEGCVLVFDVTNSKSFAALNYWLNLYTQNNPQTRGGPPPIIVIGNKSDCGARLRKVSILRAKRWCQQNGLLPYFELTAKNYERTEAAFMTVIALALHCKEPLT
ncbi:hypothetical protein L0F63_006664, partial [Massospora cicadina]